MILLDVTARPVIAHRGASPEYPENTVLAFREALRQGADAIELDVRLAGDGLPVVIHDATVDRTTDGGGLVAEMPARVLEGLDAGRGEPVPTLERVLETFPSVPFIVELKDPDSAHAVTGLLGRLEAGGRVMVGSFHAEALRRIPGWIARSASRGQVAACWAVSRLRWSWWSGRYQAFTVPERRGRLRIVDRRFVRLAHRMGKPVHVWTVDAPDAASRLWASGVCGIITNRPAVIREARDRG